jgi:hypothetical protein
MNAMFHDINFKLCAIQALMYEKKLLTPKFDVYKFVKSHKDGDIDINEEGYDVIPEVLEYFRKLEIPTELLTTITEIYQDGGNDIYMQISPFWDGEDDRFNITQTNDLSLFPNLTKMTIFHGENTTILERLKAKNIDVDYL